MKTETKAPKTTRVTLPEAIYMQIKQAVKNDPTFKTIGDYLAHQLDQVKILSCEKEKLSQKLLDERAAAGQSIAASEQRVAEAEELAKKLQEDLLNVSRANTDLSNQNAELSQQIANLEQERAVFETANIELNSKISVLESGKAVFASEIIDLNSRISDYQSTVQCLREQNTVLEQKQLESIDKINGLQAALDAESVNVRKYQQESEELARKLECREEVIFGLQKEIAEKETFTGKIKNLFA